MRQLTILILAMVCWLAPSVAGASALPRLDGLWMPIGVSLGGAIRQEGSIGFVLGGELSVVDLRPHNSANVWWFGGVADATWDFAHEAMRHRVGAEVGLAVANFEVAYLGELHEGAYRPGFNLRAGFSQAFVSIYGGYGHLFGDGAGANFGELGFLVKFPIPLAIGANRPGNKSH